MLYRRVNKQGVVAFMCIGFYVSGHPMLDLDYVVEAETWRANFRCPMDERIFSFSSCSVQASYFICYSSRLTICLTIFNPVEHSGQGRLFCC